MRKFSRDEARSLTLAAQGLARPDPFGKGIVGAEVALRHLGYVQIDTISVVERAHHHVLWSRVSDYAPAMLQNLVAERKAFEYWSHAASYLPMTDFRFTLPRKRLYASGKRHWFRPTAAHKKWRKLILERVASEGPVSSRDFAIPKRKSGWFERTPAKQMLEQLFMEGALMVTGRKGFEKQFDLAERVVPAHVDTSFPSESEYARHLIANAVRAHGLVRVDEIAYLRSAAVRENVAKTASEMLREGFLTEVHVEGATRPYLAAPQGASVEWTSDIKILSPFDNHVIQRKRLRELFKFDYVIECYVPEPKRKYGYFCLPVLKGTEFIGRIDAKADRARGVLEVKAAHPEKGKTRDFLEVIRPALVEFARFNGCFNGCE